MLRQLENHEIACYQSWLQKRVSIEEIQARKIGSPAPSDALWQQFLAQMKPSDDLWQYSSPREDWQNMIGECGVAIVRNGDVFDVFILLHN